LLSALRPPEIRNEPHNASSCRRRSFFVACDRRNAPT
jgi:hypothetical protein